ncbi:MAG: baseplate J/gp47 family protein [Spirochaetes bacterium]|nr:baseplate J/gp47 family protein [Spirochaetota bacterium]
MGFFNVSETAIKEKLKTKLQNKLSINEITNYNVGGVLRDFIEIAGYFFYLLYRKLEIIFTNVFASSASDDWLDEKCKDVNIIRNPATKVTGYFIFGRNIVSSTSIVIENDKIIKTATNISGKQYSFIVTEETVLPADIQEISVPVESSGTGTGYNIIAGTSVSLVSPIDGIDYVTVPSDWIEIPAEDKEKDGPLYERYKLQWESTNEGSPAWYKKLAINVDGVKDVVIVPTLDGAGTLGIIISAVSGEASVPLVAEVQSVIDANLYFDGIQPTVYAAENVEHSINITFDCFSLPDVEDAFRTSINETIAAFINTEQSIGVDFIPMKLKGYLDNQFKGFIKNITFSNESIITISKTQILDLTVVLPVTINTGVEE